uniref:Fibronectin type-III domain-containing protein n=1 Tax=Strongyloides papillosus TaxID=174720 RepID=A0A0N5BNB6_STREA
MEENQDQSEIPSVAEKEDALPPAKRARRSAALKSENTWKNIIYDDSNPVIEGTVNENPRKKNKVDDKEVKEDTEEKSANTPLAKPTRRKSTKPKGRQKKTEEKAASSNDDANKDNVTINNGDKIQPNCEGKLISSDEKLILVGTSSTVEEKLSVPAKRKGRGSVASKTPKLPSVLVVKPPSKNKDVSGETNLELGPTKTFNITPDMKHNLPSSVNSRHVITVTNSNFSVINAAQSNIQNQALKNKISQIISKHGTKILSGQSLFEANKVLDEMCSTIEKLIEENKAYVANAEKMEKNLKNTIQIKDNKINNLNRKITFLENELTKINRQKQLDVIENLSMYNNNVNEICENNVSANSHVVSNEFTVPSVHGNSHGISNAISDFTSTYTMDDNLLTDRHMLSSSNETFVLSKPPQRHTSRVSGQDLPYYNSTGNSYQQNAYAAGYGMNALEMERDIMPISTNPLNITSVQQGIRSERSVVEKNGVTYQDL